MTAVNRAFSLIDTRISRCDAGSGAVPLSSASGLVQMTLLLPWVDRSDPITRADVPSRNDGVAPGWPLTVFPSAHTSGVGLATPPIATVRFPLTAENPPDPASVVLVSVRQLTLPAAVPNGRVNVAADPPPSISSTPPRRATTLPVLLANAAGTRSTPPVMFTRVVPGENASWSVVVLVRMRNPGPALFTGAVAALSGAEVIRA